MAQEDPLGQGTYFNLKKTARIFKIAWKLHLLLKMIKTMSCLKMSLHHFQLMEWLEKLNSTLLNSPGCSIPTLKLYVISEIWSSISLGDGSSSYFNSTLLLKEVPPYLVHRFTNKVLNSYSELFSSGSFVLLETSVFIQSLLLEERKAKPHRNRYNNRHTYVVSSGLHITQTNF